MLELLTAFWADLLFGDPVYAYHPARLIGRAIAWGEDFLRVRIPNEKIAGAVLAFTLPVLVFGLTFAAIAGLTSLHPFLGFFSGVFGIYSVISVRDLHQEGERVLQDLEKGDLAAARQNVARIVGRDTENLDETEVTRAAVEAVSESTVDGIIAPLFFAALGGAPLALAYKAVNTLDSMIGHQNERYRDFGFFAAKQDEFWNWVPARFSLFLTAAAVFLMRGRTREAWQAGWQHALSLRGNSAVPEASFAGALGVRLGGPSTYQGRLVKKPYLGEAEKELDRTDLRKSLRLMLRVSWLALALALILRMIFKL